MEKQAGFWLRVVLLLAALSSTQSVDVVHKLGDVLVLRPPKPGPFTNVLWKHNGNLVAEWTADVGDLDYFGSFRGRTTLNTTTGNLIIKDVTLPDSGVFTVELSNTVQDERYNVKVIKGLLKPTIWVRPVSCSPESSACTLICGADTKDAGSVTYSWREDAKEWKELEESLNITKTEDGHVKTVTCRMKNPVSEEESASIDNPLYVSPNIIGIVVGVSASLAVLVLGGLGIWKREEIKKRLSGEYSPAPTGANGTELPTTAASNSSAPPGEQPKPATGP